MASRIQDSAGSVHRYHESARRALETFNCLKDFRRACLDSRQLNYCCVQGTHRSCACVIFASGERVSHDQRICSIKNPRASKAAAAVVQGRFSTEWRGIHKSRSSQGRRQQPSPNKGEIFFLDPHVEEEKLFLALRLPIVADDCRPALHIFRAARHRLKALSHHPWLCKRRGHLCSHDPSTLLRFNVAVFLLLPRALLLLRHYLGAHFKAGGPRRSSRPEFQLIFLLSRLNQRDVQRGRGLPPARVALAPGACS